MSSPEVAFVTDEPGSNGFARKARALARAFDDRGVPFDAVYMKCLDGRGEVSASGCTREVGLGSRRAALATPALVRYLRCERPRLTVVNSGQMGPAAVLAGILTGSAVVPWEPAFLDRDLASLPVRMRVMALAQRRLYPRAPAVVAPSRDMVDWAVRDRGIDPARVHLLPNPVDSAAIRAAGGVEGPGPEDPLRLCAVGRLVAQKGYDVLIEALVRGRRWLPSSWRLKIVGEAGIWQGSWGERIERLVRDHGLEANVELSGYLDNPHVVMRRSHLFVHAARWEPFGNVLVEALALGLPIVATDCPGGPGEILDGGRFGRLVPSDDPEALGSAIVELAADPGRRRALAAAGPARAEAYSPAAVASRILDIAAQVSPPQPGGAGLRRQTVTRARR